ncbi:la-related protein 6A-like isoform X1 [Primulina tabacum]|uniref:la-related protein 6A-like isoform X1 n=1 Tax=Primulina tabacum TaxID=48773 RepID=UPI003F5A9031
MEKAEGHGIPIPTSSSPDSDHGEYNPDSAPVGSPDVIGFHLSPSAVLSDDLRCKIIKQVEYYFSDENLPKDKFLLKYVTRKDGYGIFYLPVPIGVIASFRKMKNLTRDMSLIVAALKESSLVVVSSNGKKVKRLHPLPVKDPMVCTILVENLPEDHSVENLYRVFGEAGKINNITIRDPHDAREPKKFTVTEKLISGKLHAFVEYDTVEAAEKSVTLLNNEQDWRYGLRVKLLKKVNKAGQKNFFWRESESERCNPVQVSEPSGNEENRDSIEQHESHDEEIMDQSLRERNGVHLAKEKNGLKGRNHAPGRRQKHHGPNGHGHVTQFSGHGIEPSKPPPGPKMPDGTRGFAMGRGRPATIN